MEKDKEAYTVKQLAMYCNCTKRPVNKILDRLQLPSTQITQNGKSVAAYFLTYSQLQGMKNKINEHKKNLLSTTTDIDNSNLHSNQQYQELLNKYIEIKSLYDISQTSVKLLEDRQSGMLAEIKEREAKEKELIKEAAALSATMTVKDAEIKSLSSKSELHKKIAITASCVCLILLLLLLFALVIRY